jgi:pimeloyl-ACP methyl ester carboxylesterase
LDYDVNKEIEMERKKIGFVSLIIGLLLPILASGNGFSQLSLKGDWLGGLETPKGWKTFKVHFEEEAGAYKGSMELPPGVLSVEGKDEHFVLKDVSLKAERLQFALQGKDGAYVFEGKLQNGLFSGNYKKGDVSGKFQLIPETEVLPEVFEKHLGEYMLDQKNYISIFKESQQGEEGELGFYDSQTNRAGFFQAVSESSFISGLSFQSLFPVDIRAQFLRDDSGSAHQLIWKREDSPEVRIPRAKVFYEENVTYPSGQVTLAGGLRIPFGEGPFPAVVFVHGSGPGTRNQVSLLAHVFLHNGIAVLGFDKRGCGKSTGDWRRIDFPEMASDVLAGVKFLQNHEKINPRQVGLYGISQGGWIVALAASLSQEVAFIISHSGPGVSPKMQEFTMLTNMLTMSGISQKDIDSALEAMDLMYTFGRTGKGADKLDAKVRELQRNPKLSEVTPPFSKDITWENLYEKSGQTMGDPGWFFHLDVDFDPIPSYKKVRCPALILFGRHDFTVPVEESVERIEKALKESGHPDYTIRIFENGAHGLFEVDTDNPFQPASPACFIPGYLEYLVTWLKKSIYPKGLS